jgi:hypothetical protein
MPITETAARRELISAVFAIGLYAELAGAERRLSIKNSLKRYGSVSRPRSFTSKYRN